MQTQYKIAIVDDEAPILNMLSKFLGKNEQYNVTTFSNPVLALDAIDSSYDLALLDIMMPQMNGLDLLEKLHDKDDKLKVIMMTAYSTLDTVLKSHKNGALQYLMKPFNSLPTLEKKIKEVLEAE